MEVYDMRKISQKELEEIISEHEKWRKTKYKTGKRAVLSDVDLSDKAIIARDLSGVILTNSFLCRTNLRRTTLDGTNLTNTSLCGANLYRVSFNRAKVNSTDLTGAKSKCTIYTCIDLCGFKGIDKMEHQAPSSVGVDTLKLTRSSLQKRYGSSSHKQIEIRDQIGIFLRQCGIEEDFLKVFWYTRQKYVAKYHTVFMSYSFRDRVFADKLYYSLQKSNVRCWYAPVDLKVGDIIDNEIFDAIRSCDKLIIICSKSSLKSPWVEREIKTALRKEELAERDDEQLNILVPVLLDEAIFEWKSLYREDILKRLYCDFSGWENDEEFNGRLQELLRALRKEHNVSSSRLKK